MVNQKILAATKKLSNNTYHKAMNRAQKATHPSPKAAYKGAVISGGIGLVLLAAGGVGLLFNLHLWAWGLLGSGIIVVGVNVFSALRSISK